MFDIVTVGHFSIDFIKSPRRLAPKPTLGGPPTYTSLAARYLGAKVSVISKVGEDFPPRYITWLKNQGVDLSALKRVEGALTTSFLLNYCGDGERQLILKNKAPSIDVEDIPDSFESKAVHISPIANEISYEAIIKLRGLTRIVSLDPQGFLRYFDKNGKTHLKRMENPKVLENIDIFKSSREEIEAATGKSDLLQSIKRVNMYGAKIVIVTRGVKGSLLYAKGRVYEIPASKPRVVVDTTGAGDIFIGAFLAEYIQEKDPVWCACVGSASASFVAEKLGPRGFGCKKEVYERAAQVYEKISVIM